MKNFLLILSIIFLVVSCNKKNEELDYLVTSLLPYPENSDLKIKKIYPEYDINDYTILETDIENSPLYFGTTKEGGNTIFWMKFGNKYSLFGMAKDSVLNVYKDTIVMDWDNKTKKIVYEAIYNPTLKTLSYNWLDKNNKKVPKAQIIDIDLPLAVGKTFPDIEVEQLNGEKLAFADLKGKVLLINWWHTRCGGCLVEIAGLNKLKNKYKDNPNIEFVAISIDKKDDLVAFLQKNKFNYTQTLVSRDLEQTFGNGYPVNIVVSSDGIIQANMTGGSEDTYLKVEEKLLSVLK
ncbi:TlpA family protein disulfide reductase [Flavobacterium agricola]|uniref:TlpA family protein disulfide reductase n=1 Tax=Flavobacterium agricola TaxID=2870839 RepID=A0ABY6M1T7_9FLAO|nr:TlpA disulfide reductase family protein [Flavobacterium agricola]UYW01198.1 TlpA family protein disulfide reductase [Flavobacterium agricola]